MNANGSDFKPWRRELHISKMKSIIEATVTFVTANTLAIVKSIGWIPNTLQFYQFLIIFISKVSFGPIFILKFVFSRESDSRIANVRLSVRYKNPSASLNCSYRPSSLSAIQPINHRAYRPSSLLTLALLLQLLSLLAYFFLNASLSN